MLTNYSILCYSFITMSTESGGCNEDTSTLAKTNRQTRLTNATKSFTYSKSKCSPSTNASMSAFYQGYKEFPIDFTNCDNRDKAFVISDDCKGFKYSINGTLSTDQSYLDQYNSCIADPNATTDCQTYLNNMYTNKIKNWLKNNY